MKDYEVRLNETVAFIKDMTVSKNADKRKDVHAIMGVFVKDLAVSETDVKSLSGYMTQTDSNNKDDKTQRAQRRALILMHAFLNRALPEKYPDYSDVVKKKVLELKPEALTPALESLLAEVTTVNQMGSPTVLRPLLDQLLKTPDKFLAEHRLVIEQNTAHKNGGKMPFYFFYSPTSAAYVFTPIKPNEARFKPIAGGLVTKDAFEIPVISSKTLKENNKKIALPEFEVKDVDLMLTMQLTGCAVCYQTKGNKLTACHIQPGGDNNFKEGVGLAKALAAEGHFASNPDGVFKVAGKLASEGENGYATQPTHVVGVKGSSGWALYMQTAERGKTMIVKKLKTS